MSHSGSLFGGILLNTTAYHNNNNSLIDVFDAGRMFGNNNNNMSMPGHNNNNNNNSMFMSTVVNNNSNNNNSMFEVVEPVSRAKMLILGMTLKQIHDAILLMLLLFVMFSMGCGVTLRQIFDHLRRPTAVLLCLFAQFFVVPLIAFVMIITFGLSPLNAAGLLILSCCPGGVTSNIFTIFLQGDLPLSITMTSVATVAAVVLMPLNTFVYGYFLNLQAVTLPIMDMVNTLTTVTVPVFVGLGVKWWKPAVAAFTNRVGGFIGLSVLLFIMCLEAYMFPSLFQQAPLKIWVSVIILPVVSFAAGMLLSRLFRMDSKISRTIGIEIGIKNVGSALTVITLSFSHQELRHVWAFPFLYAFTSFLMILGVLVIKRVTEAASHSDMTLVPASDDSKDAALTEVLAAAGDEPNEYNDTNNNLEGDKMVKMFEMEAISTPSSSNLSSGSMRRNSSFLTRTSSTNSSRRSSFFT